MVLKCSKLKSARNVGKFQKIRMNVFKKTGNISKILFSNHFIEGKSDSVFEFRDLIYPPTPGKLRLFDQKCDFQFSRTGIVPLRSVEGRMVKSDIIFEFCDRLYPPTAGKSRSFYRNSSFSISLDRTAVATHQSPDDQKLTSYSASTGISTPRLSLIHI